MRPSNSILILPALFAFVFLNTIMTAQQPTTTSAPANPIHQEPLDAKAKKTYDEAGKYFKERKFSDALDSFRKANKQDGGRCIQCELRAWSAALAIRDYKAAREQANLLLEQVTDPRDKAQAQYMLGRVFLAEGIEKRRDSDYDSAHQQFAAALAANANKPDILYNDGIALAYLRKDDEAKLRFQSFLKNSDTSNINYERATRFSLNPEQARVKLAPNFKLTTIDGKTITLDSLAGKVVLIDFWATWCGPCRAALPHIKELAKKFDGQPFVVLSVSMDSDDSAWKDFVSKNGMTWLQARDGRFTGPLATLFSVPAIPATFTIDAEGVLQDQHIGDADIEGKLKKLIARANDLQKKSATQSPGAGN